MQRLTPALCLFWLAHGPPIYAQPTSQTAPPKKTTPSSQPVWVDETNVIAPHTDALQAPVGGQSFALNPDKNWGAQDTAAEVIKKLPGVTIRAAGGDGQRQIVLLRGASEEQVLLLLDGIRLNEAGGGGVDLSEIPAASIARVEVVTGSAAALYGSEAMGGVILLTTRSAYQQSQAELISSVSSFSTIRVNAARLDQIGAWGVFAQLSALDSSGEYPFIDTNDNARTRGNNNAQQLSGLLKAERLIGDAWSLSLLSKASLSQRGIAGPEQFESLTAKQEVKRLFFSARLHGSEISPGLEYSFLSSLRIGDVHFADPDPLLGRPIDTAATEIAPSLGWRFLWSSPNLTRPSASAGSAFGPPSPIQRNGEGRNFQRKFRGEVGGDLSWSYEDLLTEELVSGDARRIRGSMALFGELNFNKLSVAPALRLEGASTFGLSPVPRLGLSYRIAESLQLKASAGRSYRVPSLRDLFLQVDGISGNPDLSPEDAWEISAGVSREGERFTLSANAFARDLRNVILFTQQSVFEIVAQNFTGYTTKGAELYTSLALSPFTLEASFTHLNTKSESGLFLPGVAKDRAVARASYQRGHLQLFTALEAQTSFFVNAHNTIVAPERRLLSSGASLSFAEQCSLSLEGQNLLNEQNLIDALQLPLPPRVFTLTLRGVF